MPEKDEDCSNCRHPRSQHEIEPDTAEIGHDLIHEARGPCEVRICFCPRFLSAGLFTYESLR
jgi:hypothetical protein